jgi:hypothetical protein
LEVDGATDDPRYDEPMIEHHHVLHVLRMPLEEPPPFPRS